MADYKVVTLWWNIAKIMALSVAAVVAAFACGVPHVGVFIVGAIAPLIGAAIWETHTIRIVPEQGEG